MDFDDALNYGRKRAYYFGLWPRSTGRILTLQPLLDALPPREERSGGLQDIEADKIIGTEDRAGDFSDGFFPLHRYMRNRWEKIYHLMDQGTLNEPLKVFEYGGCYFIRDGHHRVSAGRALGVEFHSAEVTHLKIDVKLPPAMNAEKIPLLLAKHRFEQETCGISILGELAFRVKKTETWDSLTRILTQGHKTWFVSVHGRTPEKDELVRNWNEEIYSSTMDSIRRHALPSLFPGLDDTDIFVDIMSYWESVHPGQWFETVFRAYLDRARSRAFTRIFLHGLYAVARKYFSPLEEERQHFVRVSRIKVFRPEARLPQGGRRWYRFLEHQLLGSHFRYLHQKLGRMPLMDELTTSWYDTLFFPALCLWEISDTDMSFSRFYPGWMLSWERQLRRTGQLPPLDESFRSYRQGLNVRLMNRLARFFDF